MAEKGSALLEFALVWPVVMTLALAAVQVGIWQGEVSAASAAALAGAEAGAARGGGTSVAAEVAVASVRPALVGSSARPGCGGPAPASLNVCAKESGGELTVRVFGSVPVLVPILAAALQVDAHAAAPIQSYS